METRSRTAKKKSIWGLHSFVVITGASRGIGKTIAIEVSRLIGKNSIMLLMANRSQLGLEATRNEILSMRRDIDVKMHLLDFSQAYEYEYTHALVKAAEVVMYDLFLLINNGGTMKSDLPATLMNDIPRWDEYMTTNLFSAATITSIFLKLFKRDVRCVVNISSVAAHEPLKGLAMYCAAQAAREQYFKVLAVEEPSVNVLNYLPAPVDTDMLRSTIAACCYPDVAEVMSHKLNTNGCVKVEDVVAKLILLLKKQNYKSGDSVHYFKGIL